MPATLVLDVLVFGTPATQGSKVPGVAADGRRFVREENPDLKRWRTQVAQAVGEEYHDRGYAEPLDGPLGLDLVFYRPRPKDHHKASGGLSAKGQRNTYPTTAPDALKLARAVEDAIRKVVYYDDSQTVDLRVRKAYGHARVRIRLYKLDVESA